MDLLEFAKGPALQVAAYILVAGSIWRLVGILLLKEKPDYSEPRQSAGLLAALKVIYTRSFTAQPFKARNAVSEDAGLRHAHRPVRGRSPVRPSHHVLRGIPGIRVARTAEQHVIYLLGVAAVVASFALLVRRLTSPVLKLISNFDDYFSWLVTVLPLITGLMIPVRMGLRYETILAIHILSVALLMIWLPFGKLGHTFLVFITRGTTGMVFERRGAKT